MRARADDSVVSLVLFTVCAQAAAGIGALGLLLPEEALRPQAPAIALGLLALGGLTAHAHLGRPGRAPLALANLKTSWLSREVLLGLVLALMLVVGIAAGSTSHSLGLGIATALLGVGFVHAIAGIYRLRTVPAWDSWTTPASFLGTALVLGGVTCALLLSRQGDDPAVPWLAGLTAVVTGLRLLVTDRQLETTARTRHATLVGAHVVTSLTGAVLLLAVVSIPPGDRRAALLAVATAVLLASELLGRRLFYASHRRIGL